MKKAFTLIELAFIIIIISLLCISFIRPNIASTMQGAKQILQDIKLVRMLAMKEGGFHAYEKKNEKYFKKRWQLYFIKSKRATKNKLTYSIFYDANADGNANLASKTNINDKGEIAQGVGNTLLSGGQSGVLLSSNKRVYKRQLIEEKYGIKSVDFIGGCEKSHGLEVRRLVFDTHARLQGAQARASRLGAALQKDQTCVLVLRGDKNVCIQIDTLSGFARIAEYKKGVQWLSINGGKYRCDKL